MVQSPQELFDAVRADAGDKLLHAETVRMLIDAALPAQDEILYAVGFKAKFLVRTWGVMKRLGADDPARAQLKEVFYREFEEVRRSLGELVAHAGDAARTTFEQTFLAVDGQAFVRCMDLLQDLAWIQNVRIGRRR